MPTTFPSSANNFATVLASAHAPGSGVLVIVPRADTTLAEAVARAGFPVVSPSAPLRLMVVKQAALDGFLVTDVTQTTVFDVTGVGVDGVTLTGAVAVEGTADQSFAAGAAVGCVRTSGVEYLYGSAIGALESGGGGTVTLAGDVSGSGAGSVTTAIGAGKVTNAMLSGSVTAAKLVGTDIATLGTVTTGTWHGSVLAPAYTGTGTPGAGKYVDGGTGAWTTLPLGDGAGTVTSVGLGLPAELTVAGSPVTSSGTLSAKWASQSANRVFAGPAAGGAAVPGFRALVAADVPTIAQNQVTGLTAALAALVPQTTTVNGHSLSANVTVTKSDVSLGSVENTALSTWAGSTNLTTLGTIATGVWHGSTLGPAYTGTGTPASGTYVDGGTGAWTVLPSAGGGSDATLTFTDITTNNASTTKHGFAPKLSGNAAQYYSGTGVYSIPTVGGSSPVVGGAVTGGTPGSVLQVDGSGNLAQFPLARGVINVLNPGAGLAPAVGDGVTDDWAVIQAAIDAYPGHTIYLPTRRSGTYVPSYLLLGTLTLSGAGTSLVGDGSGFLANQGGTVLEFGTPDVPGIVIANDGCRVEHLKLLGCQRWDQPRRYQGILPSGRYTNVDGGPPGVDANTFVPGVGTCEADGILVQRSTAHVSNVFIEGFGRHGVMITFGDNGFYGNVRCWNNRGYGIFVAPGQDTNTLYFVKCIAEVNQLGGMRDLCFLGNTWISPMCEENNIDSFQFDDDTSHPANQVHYTGNNQFGTPVDCHIPAANVVSITRSSNVATLTVDWAYRIDDGGDGTGTKALVSGQAVVLTGTTGGAFDGTWLIRTAADVGGGTGAQYTLHCPGADVSSPVTAGLMRCANPFEMWLAAQAAIRSVNPSLLPATGLLGTDYFFLSPGATVISPYSESGRMMQFATGTVVIGPVGGAADGQYDPAYGMPNVIWGQIPGLGMPGTSPQSVLYPGTATDVVTLRKYGLYADAALSVKKAWQSSKSVTSVSLTSNVATVTTATAHAFAAGAVVAVSGLARSKTITNVALTSNVATLTTSGAHTFTVGTPITVSGLTTSALNGSYTISAVTGTTLSYALTHANIASAADSGTVSDPAVAALNGAPYTITGVTGTTLSFAFTHANFSATTPDAGTVASYVNTYKYTLTDHLDYLRLWQSDPQIDLAALVRWEVNWATGNTDLNSAGSGQLRLNATAGSGTGGLAIGDGGGTNHTTLNGTSLALPTVGDSTAANGSVFLSSAHQVGGHPFPAFRDSAGTVTSLAPSGGGGSPGGSSGQLQYNSSSSFGGTAAGAYATSGDIFTFTAPAATDTPLVVKGAGSQSASLMECRTSANAVLFKASPDGSVTTQPGTAQSVRVGPLPGDPSYGGVWVGQSSPDSTNFALLAQTGSTVFNGTLGLSFRAGNFAAMFVDPNGGVPRTIFSYLPDATFGDTSAVVSVVTADAALKGQVVRGRASQAGNLQEWQGSAGAVLSTVSENGYFTTRKTSAPADAELSNSEAAFWLDDTPGTTVFKIKAKDSTGTVRTGSVSLT